MLNYNELSVTQATVLQKALREQVSLVPLSKEIRRIAGADISFNRYSPTVYAGIVIMTYPDMEVVSYSLAVAEVTFPYVSGYLAFREVPPLLTAWDQIPEKPDLVILDGQGIAHPRRMGIASHFGVLADVPTIGCAKSMLFGEFTLPEPVCGATSPILEKSTGDLLGYTLRTKDKVKPVYISPGHLINSGDAVAVMKNCIGKYRIPEPTRLAHQYVNELRTGQLSAGYHTR